MTTQKEIVTTSDARKVPGKTAKKSALAREKIATVAESIVADKKNTAVKRKAAAKPDPDQAKPRVARKRAASNPVTAGVPAVARKKTLITQDQRQQLLCDAAYLISLKRPTCTGSPEIDWLQAEAVIDMIFDATG